jgi:hypothetical protein
MSSKIPYVSSPTLMTKILEKIRVAKTPERFTLDFLETVLGFKGGNYQHFISLAKKIGFLNSDGTPTDIYKSFRNPDSEKAAMAAAIRHGYKELFQRNEYAGDLAPEKLRGLVVEITGKESTDRVVQLVCQTFAVLKKFADFATKWHKDIPNHEDPHVKDLSIRPQKEDFQKEDDQIDLRLSYTINLVLPKTDDPAVFNAIFRSLRDNLLSK